MADHDHSYKLLFSQPETVAHLLSHLKRREKWIAELDLATLEPVPAHRLSDDLRERENDVVWRVRWQGRWLYLMIEFQSSDDKWMAVRVMAYQALLYQDLIRLKAGRPGDLPAVAAIVLYNGEEAWKAAQEISELIGKVPRGLRRYLPRLRFILVDISRLKPSQLKQKGNLAVRVYRLEQCKSEAEVQGELLGLFEELGKPGRSEVKRAFLTWLRRVRLHSRFPGLVLPELRQEEKSAMLEERVRRWTEQWKAEGLQEGLRMGLQEGRQEGRREGRQEGRQAGLREGEAAALIRQVEFKFGPLASGYRERIQAADSSTLQEWLQRILTAGRLEEVFDPVDPPQKSLREA